MGDPIQRREAAPKRYRKLHKNATDGKCSPRSAIRLMCLVCVGYQVNEVKLCTDRACPLFAYRPFRGRKSAKCARVPRSAGLGAPDASERKKGTQGTPAPSDAANSDLTPVLTGVREGGAA